MDVSLFVQFLRPFQWSSLWDLSRGLTSICWSIYMMCLRRRRGVDPVILSPLVKGESCRMRHHAPQSDYLPFPGWNCSPFGLSTIVLWPLCQVLPCKSLTRFNWSMERLRHTLLFCLYVGCVYRDRNWGIGPWFGPQVCRPGRRWVEGFPCVKAWEEETLLSWTTWLRKVT